MLSKKLFFAAITLIGFSLLGVGIANGSTCSGAFVGGTGICYPTVPIHGDVLVGNGSTGWVQTATSSLGITSASSTVLSDNNTFSGNDTFSNPITGSVTGNAGTATILQTARTINGVSFNGSANITIPIASSTLLSDNNTFSGHNIFSGTASTTNLEMTLYADNFAGSDIGAKINAAYAAGTTGVQIVVPRGSYSFSTPIQINTSGKPASIICAPGNGTTLNYTGTATSTIFDVTGNTSQYNAYGMFGCNLNGPGIAGNEGTDTGIELGPTNGGTGAILQGDRIQHFGTGLAVGAFTYIAQINSSWLTNDGQAFEYEGETDSGESISFSGDLLGNGDASSTLFADKAQNCVNIEKNMDEATFYQTSFDSCDVYVGVGTANAVFSGDHFENPNATGAQPFIYVATSTFSKVSITGANFLNDGNNASTTPTQFITAYGLVNVSDSILYQNGRQTVTNFIVTGTDGSFTLSNLYNLNGATISDWANNINVPSGATNSGILDYLANANNGTPGGFSMNSSGVFNFYNNTANPLSISSTAVTVNPTLTVSNGAQNMTMNASYGGSTPTFGTVSTDPLVFITNNSERARFLSTGQFGISSTTPGSLLSIGPSSGGINFSLSTSTFSNVQGINLTTGCYAINGTCLTQNAGTVTAVNGTTNQITSSGGTTPTLSLPSLVIFPGNIEAFASSTIGGGTQATGLTIVGGATSTLLDNFTGGFISGASSTVVGAFTNTGNIVTGGTGTINGGSLSVGGSGAVLNVNNGGQNMTMNSSYGGSTPTFGTVSTDPLQFIANNTPVARFTSTGNYGQGTSTPYAFHDIESVSGTNYPGNILFRVGSSTAATWNSLFSVSNTGAIFAPSTANSGSAQTGYWCYDTNGQLIRDTAACLTSAARFKMNISDITESQALDEALALQPVSYFYKPDFNGSFQSDPNYSGEQVGFVADQVQQVDPRLVDVETATTTFEGKTYAPGTVQTFRPDAIEAILDGAIKEQQVEIQQMTDAAGTPIRSAEENWQWIAIGLLAAWNIYLTFRRRK